MKIEFDSDSLWIKPKKTDRSYVLEIGIGEYQKDIAAKLTAISGDSTLYHWSLEIEEKE